MDLICTHPYNTLLIIEVDPIFSANIINSEKCLETAAISKIFFKTLVFTTRYDDFFRRIGKSKAGGQEVPSYFKKITTQESSEQAIRLAALYCKKSRKGLSHKSTSSQIHTSFFPFYG